MPIINRTERAMRTHVKARPAAAAARSALPESRGFDAAGGSASAGHDFGHVAVSAAPIQMARRKVPATAAVHAAVDHLRQGRIYEMATAHAALSPAEQAQFQRRVDHTRLRDRMNRVQGGVASGLGTGVADFRHGTADWTAPEVAEVENAFARVPDDHRAGLTSVNRWRRGPNPVGQADTEGGETFAGRGELRIYDQGVNGAFGAPLAASSLARHDTTLPAGAPGGPVSSLEYTATHELGHVVASSKPAAYTAFRNAVGYRTISDAQLGTDLAGYDGAAGHVRAGGRADVAGQTYRRSPEVANSHLVHPVGAIPGSPSPALDPLNAYAHTQPGEHFAELYAQMVHAPEQAHQQYVQQPAADVANAQAALAAHDTARSQRGMFSKLWNRKSDAATRQTLADRLAEAQAAQQSRAGAHRVMRQDVFGVTPAAVAAERTQVRGKNARTRDRRRAWFDQRSAVASTPQHLEELRRQAMRQ